MFAFNAWYVGAWADELKPRGLLGRVLLGLPVVFYRAEGCTAFALEDRCCHRGLPLSHGCVIGDQLQCGYHGLVYDRSGLYVKVPGQERVPAQAEVKSYTVVERDRMLWIWMGDPALADPALIVRHPRHDYPAWVWIKDRYSINANYQLITDNLMDLTHVGYVHGRTIGGTPQAHSDADTKTTRSETSVKVARWMMNSVPPAANLSKQRHRDCTIWAWFRLQELMRRSGNAGWPKWFVCQRPGVWMWSCFLGFRALSRRSPAPFFLTASSPKTRASAISFLRLPAKTCMRPRAGSRWKAWASNCQTLCACPWGRLK